MGSAQWVLELVLLLLLTATLFHALRLERALGVLKRDRAVLEELVEGFNDSTRQAESGIERLRSAAEGAGRQISRQIDAGQVLRDDLSFLADRSDRLAQRLETVLRSARMFADSTALSAAATHGGPLTQSVQAGRITETTDAFGKASPAISGGVALNDATEDQAPRLRSQAERDLLRVLRAGN